MNKMLIVDDDWMISDSLKTMEEWIDLDIDVVSTAENGQEALYWLEKEPIDIILTDIRMPHMDGLELTKHILDHKLHPAVIIMSGYEEFSYAQKALHYNAKGYILKPIDVNELFDLIKKVTQELASRQQTLNENPDLGSSEPQTQQERLITNTISYIQSNYKEPLTLKLLADRIHLSEHYLGQLFKTVTGESFISYLTTLRMKRSCELLKNPILKVYEISERVGYTDSKHFTKVFKKTYGCTPKEYRKGVVRSTV
ncbi:response regulator transcription factor [Halalkalibacter krulwichiae]|uniref:Putative response regulatory protein n=1 Tax=Halalkalibacter krulwichiae TaxID=199441 RepID=A0A1X9MDD0_9BACI|nr:response regulator [Halalkalibacter krulwichiae]ARK30133.1 putative response regulatory protein [Halalkalibacter krulwichiae]